MKLLLQDIHCLVAREDHELPSRVGVQHIFQCAELQIHLARKEHGQGSAVVGVDEGEESPGDGRRRLVSVGLLVPTQRAAREEHGEQDDGHGEGDVDPGAPGYAAAPDVRT